MHANKGSRGGRLRATAILTAVAASAGGLVASPAAAQAKPVAGSAEKPAPLQLEEVVVTASRRAESLLKTPIAVSAYGGEQLEKQHVQSLADLATQSPNIQLAGYGADTNITIRGIGTNLLTAGSDPGVALYSDGVYVPEAAVAFATMYDTKRVEVLRGPQGTLFGRDATGGAVDIISNTPTNQPEYGLDISAGAPLGERALLFASGPLASDGSLLGRLAIQQNFQRGDTKNVVPGAPGRLNDQNDFATRGQLEWRPTIAFSARLQVDYQKSTTAGPAYYLVGTPNPAGLPPQLSGAPVSDPHSNTIAANQASDRMLNEGAGLFLNWDIGSGSLKVTASRRRTQIRTSNDDDGSPVDFVSQDFNQTRDTTYLEALYSSNDESRLSYIIGANYMNDDEKQAISVGVNFFPAPVNTTSHLKTRSYALFGHAEYNVTSDWKLFAGARYTDDYKSIDEENNYIGSLAHSQGWVKTTFEVGTSYDFSPRATGYLKYVTGYKSGGFSAGSLAPAFAPETDGMWEMGLKGSFFDGNLQANAALFRMAYNDLQVNQVVGVVARVTNAAQATINGAELELDQRLTPDLHVVFEGGWLDARFDQFLTEDSARPALGVLDLSGKSLPQAPRFTIGIAPVFTHQMASGGSLTLSARYDWKSRTHFSEFNLPVASQGPAGRLSAYANYDLPGGRWAVGLYGRNLTDARTFSTLVVGSAILNSITVGTLQPRREVGLMIHYRY